MSKLINVQHHYEVELIIELLKNEGIEAILDESNVGVMDIITGQSTLGYDILVDEKDLERATAIVEAYMEENNE